MAKLRECAVVELVVGCVGEGSSGDDEEDVEEGTPQRPTTLTG